MKKLFYLINNKKKSKKKTQGFIYIVFCLYLTILIIITSSSIFLFNKYILILEDSIDFNYIKKSSSLACAEEIIYRILVMNSQSIIINNRQYFDDFINKLLSKNIILRVYGFRCYLNNFELINPQSNIDDDYINNIIFKVSYTIDFGQESFIFDDIIFENGQVNI